MLLRKKIIIFCAALVLFFAQFPLLNASLTAQRVSSGYYDANPFDQSYAYGTPAPVAPKSDLAEAAGAIATIFGAVAGHKAAKEERRRQRELEARYSAPMTFQQNITVDNWGTYPPAPVTAHPGCAQGESVTVDGQHYCKHAITCGVVETLTSDGNNASCVQVFSSGGEELKSMLSCNGSTSGLRIKEKTASCLFKPEIAG